MKILYKNIETFIDEENLPLLYKYKWYVSKSGYLSFAEYIGKQLTRNFIMLHRIIADAKPEDHVDHIDGNKLNNQKSNLRLCDRSMNNFNRPKLSHSKSKYKGVQLGKAKRFFARIAINHQQISLFNSISEEKCAYAYDVAAKLLAKNFAYVNNPVLDDMSKSEVEKLVKSKLQTLIFNGKLKLS